MKMSDIFELPLYVGTDVNDYGCLEDKNTRHITTFEQHDIEVCDSIETLEYAAHAINNHDRLTEENAKLRQMLKYAVKVANDQNATYTTIEILNIEVQQLLNQLKDQNNDK